LTTGWGDDLDEEKIEQSGIDRVLAKPFRAATVQAAISDVLESQSRKINTS